VIWPPNFGKYAPGVNYILNTSSVAPAVFSAEPEEGFGEIEEVGVESEDEAGAVKR